VLIVVSDGEPSTGEEGVKALHAAIAAARRRGVHVIGLGLGADTRHVASYYKPHFVAEIPAGRFATAIGDVVLGALRGLRQT
jgi:nitric oxide reductase activation protein